jgi:hypothetical protein
VAWSGCGCVLDCGGREKEKGRSEGGNLGSEQGQGRKEGNLGLFGWDVTVVVENEGRLHHRRLCGRGLAELLGFLPVSGSSPQLLPKSPLPQWDNKNFVR